jgi:hypothetical protein
VIGAGQKSLIQIHHKFAICWSGIRVKCTQVGTCRDAQAGACVGFATSRREGIRLLSLALGGAVGPLDVYMMVSAPCSATGSSPVTGSHMLRSPGGLSSSLGEESVGGKSCKVKDSCYLSCSSFHCLECLTASGILWTLAEVLS